MPFKKRYAAALVAAVLSIICLASANNLLPYSLAAQTDYTVLNAGQDKPSPQEIEVKLNGSIYESGKTDALSDKDAIKDCVWQYNAAYLSSLFSGTWIQFPQEKCISSPLYEEANARIIYEMQNKPNAWQGVDHYDFDIQVQSVKKQGDMAKVIVMRHAEAFKNGSHSDDLNSLNSISYSGPEGYLLKKENGSWKIYNIIFVTDFYTDTYRDFVKDNNSQHWQDVYSFENCSRKTYEDTYNFRDYLLGSLEDEQLDPAVVHMGNR